MDGTFLSAAVRYWTSVFPLACSEIRSCRRRAQTIPDPILRELALDALQVERGNLEGASAFATFAPRAQRHAVVRAVVAFQAAYDYADAVSEQAWQISPRDGTACLHRCLSAAVDPFLAHGNYYAHSSRSDDGGYLRHLVDRCRGELVGRPALPVVAAALRQAASRIEAYQQFHHDHDNKMEGDTGYWAAICAELEPGLAWWEIAAAAGSSLTVFALIALATHPSVNGSRVTAIEYVYFPWTGALHTLLDSVVDRREDAKTGQRSPINRYRSDADVAARLEALAGCVAARTSAIEDKHHALIIAAMAGFYLARADGDDPLLCVVRPRVLAALGGSAESAATVLRAKRLIAAVWQRRRWPAKN